MRVSSKIMRALQFIMVVVESPLHFDFILRGQLFQLKGHFSQTVSDCLLQQVREANITVVSTQIQIQVL